MAIAVALQHWTGVPGFCPPADLPSYDHRFAPPLLNSSILLAPVER
jgi:hypothetical protein